MEIRSINDPHTRRVVAVAEDILMRAKAGRLPSLIVIAEELGKQHPHYVIVGRFRSQPVPAIGHLVVMKEKVADFAATQTPDLDDPK